MAELDEGSSAPSLQELEHLWREEATPRRLLQLAEEYRRLGRLTAAVTALEEGHERYPEHLALSVALGRCQLERGRVGEGAAVLQEVLAQDPTQLVANRLLVRAYLELGELDKARERLDFYSLLNESDPAIAELSTALENELERHGAAAAPVARGSGESLEQEPEAAVGEAWWPRRDLPLPRAAGDPFPGLYRPEDERTYVRSFLAAGIFPIVLPPDLVVAPPVITRSAAAPVDSAPEETIAPPAGESDLTASSGEPPVVESAAVAPSVPPPSLPPPPPAGAEEAVAETGADAAAATLAPGEVARSPIEFTATLGQLYLEQGHWGEAGRIFREILRRDPHNEAARQGLARLQEQPRPPLTARDLLRHAPPDPSPLGRRIGVLRRYLDVVRRSR